MPNRHCLKEFIDELKNEKLLVEVKHASDEDRADLNREVLCLTFDSRDVEESTLFICKGSQFKEEYLKTAIEKGAFAYIAEQSYDFEEVTGVIVEDIRKAMVILGELFYNHPSKEIILTGITGTKGKSTTTYFLKSILDRHCLQDGGKETAVLSSIDFYDGVTCEEAHLTTPEAITIQKHLRNAVDSGIKYCTMEVSSQGLKYDRTTGLVFDAAVYLNLGEDHISPIEHPDFEDYKNSKKRLMRQAKKVFINMDDDFAYEFFDEAIDGGVAEEVLGFSLEKREPSVAYAGRIEDTKQGEAFMLVVKDREAVAVKKATIRLKGHFNISNAVAAAAVAFNYGVPINTIVEGLAEATVPGRMESFYSEERRVEIVVDYAHNEMSFEALFDAYEDRYRKDQIAIVYGSAGGKAYGRRRELSEIAAKRAGRIYITDEDPGDEDPESVHRDIAEVLKEKGADHSYRGERRDAIELALEESKPGDIIFITGKGRETTQKRGSVYEPTESDVEIVESLINNSENV